VEVIQEKSAAAGSLSIKVVASSVSMSPQGLAIVVLGNLS